MHGNFPLKLWTFFFSRQEIYQDRTWSRSWVWVFKMLTRWILWHHSGGTATLVRKGPFCKSPYKGANPGSSAGPTMQAGTLCSHLGTSHPVTSTTSPRGKQPGLHQNCQDLILQPHLLRASVWTVQQSALPRSSGFLVCSSSSHCSCLSTCILNTVFPYWGHTYSPTGWVHAGHSPGILLDAYLLSYAVSSLCDQPHPKFQDSCGACLLFLILQQRLLASVHLVEHLFSWAVSSASSTVSLWIQTFKSSPFLQHAQTVQNS